MITKPQCLRWRALALGFILCAGGAAAQTSTSHDGPATLELKRLVATNPEVKRLLIASIERARQVNPDRLTNPAQSLEQYYDFVSWAERAMPGSLLKARTDATLYQRIDQSLAYLYFVAVYRSTNSRDVGISTTPFNTWNHTIRG